MNPYQKTIYKQAKEKGYECPALIYYEDDKIKTTEDVALFIKSTKSETYHILKNCYKSTIQVKYSDIKEMGKRKCKVCIEQWLVNKMKIRFKAKSYYKK